MTLDEAVALLLRYYQHGLTDSARTVCDAILTAVPQHPTALRYRDYLDRPARPERFRSRAGMSESDSVAVP